MENVDSTKMKTTYSWKQLVLNPQTYWNIVYLLMAFPLGTIYFCLLVPLIATGISTLIIWVGVGILIGTVYLWWEIAQFERQLAIQWLHVPIKSLQMPSYSHMNWWQRSIKLFQNPMTWRTFIFIFLKFPIGIFTFVVTITLLPLSLGIGIATFIIGCLTVPFIALFLITTNVASTQRKLQNYLIFSATGYGLGILSLIIINQMATLIGILAQAQLGMSDHEIEMQQMAAQLEKERERAEDANRRRQKLILDMSHELRTPVATISGHIESLMIMAEDQTLSSSPETISQYLHISHQEVERLGKLVEELLSLARMESDTLKLDIQAIPVRDVIEEVYQLLAPIAQKERNVALVRGADPYLPLVLADRGRLVQILMNLIRNAIAYTPSGGLVSISAESVDPEHVELVVADNGIGIPEADLVRITERFYRVDSSRSRATGGFGLGLAIVHELVAAMGGSMTIISTEEEGSRFGILLRIASS
jgi:two-component system phosphate regulon sensor histidine kinase PhoR